MMRIVALVMLFSLLGACFGGGEVVPQDRFYQLADIKGKISQFKKPFKLIAVSEIQTDAVHRQRMILYSQQSSPLMLSTYYYHQWNNTPGQMIQEYLISYLRQADFARTVVRYGERTQIDGQINGYIQHFERVVGDGHPRVKIKLELSFIPRNPGIQHSLTRVYAVEQEAADNTMESTILAFSHGLQTIFGRFVSDVMNQH